ncbi:DUF2550 domain-containing protein [Gordonia sinesedis]
MSYVVVLLSILLLAAVAVVALLAYRLSKLRGTGNIPVLLRDLPAEVDQGWRHGTVHYSDEALQYYRLSSLRPGPSRTFCRQGIEITGRRRPEGTEGEILDGMVILRLRADNDGVDSRNGAGSRTREGRDYELAMAPGGATAFQSWLESRQSDRSQRRRN